jgi:hypothetical protein
MSRRPFLAMIFAASIAAGGQHVYRNDQVRVRAFAPPAGWEMAPQSSYPRLLAAYIGADGAKLTLAGQKLGRADQSAVALAEQSRASLEKQGFTAVHIAAEGDRARVDAQVDGGKRFMKQIYVVNGGWGYVVTLIGSSAAAARSTSDFDEAVRSLQLGESASPQP